MAKYKRLSFEERVKIKMSLDQGDSMAEIARKLGRHRSTILRELARHPVHFEPRVNQALATQAASQRRKGQFKLGKNVELFNKVHQGLKKRWSPEQISIDLKKTHQGNKDMQISHEAIYTYIYVLPRGELRKELIQYLRQEKKKRYSRKGVKEKRGRIPEMISITERPQEVADRSLAGHWEGDLIVGKGHKSAIGTLVERKTRAVILVPLKAKDAKSVRKAFEKELEGLPYQMRQSLTYDQGHEMSEHKLFTENTKMKVYFCHPGSPWERGTCENTNMLVRDYFPKGTDFSLVSKRELKRVQRELNERPRKTLGYETPISVFNKEVLNVVR